ncbi:hypothetical protein [Polaribacter sp. IC073]|uniref:hypothetical protein n=1 Tax=Polaribacter sp. IC073 TaxID=2508540 RepID=UPI0011BF81A1|nr:hypothetical protein [Polaribacter sp. IC073]TXD47327.1 hypothetical protein ES045_12070 [Polaribacter sp. IC073]
MAIKNLTKEFRLIWKNDLIIILNDKFQSGSTASTIHNCFEADTESDIQYKIKKLGLIEIKETI